MSSGHDAIRLDTRPIREDRQECRAFMVVRDETVRLPWLLEHHRALGVERFFVIDNESTDGTREFVLAQPDCHLFSGPGAYSEANFGLDWINQVVEWHGERHWCLSIDADECLVYPDCERVPLPALCRYLTKIGADGLYTFMLDMYSKEPISQAHYRAGTPFLSACPYFDADYTFRPRFGRFPDIEPIGGPRLRKFYPRFRNAGFVQWTLPKLVRRARGLVGLRGPTTPPLLIKVPLIKGGSARWPDAHWTTRIKLADVTGVLLHFKYFSDFHDRVIAAQESGQHFDGGAEYAVYAEALSHDPKVSFYYEGSRKYEGSRQLVELGLIKASDEYEAFERTTLSSESVALADAS